MMRKSFRFASIALNRRSLAIPADFELAYGLDLHGVLDLHQNSRANENLPRLGFVAKPPTT